MIPPGSKLVLFKNNASNTWGDTHRYLNVLASFHNCLDQFMILIVRYIGGWMSFMHLFNSLWCLSLGKSHVFRKWTCGCVLVVFISLAHWHVFPFRSSSDLDQQSYVFRFSSLVLYIISSSRMVDATNPARLEFGIDHFPEADQVFNECSRAPIFWMFFFMFLFVYFRPFRR